MRGLLLLLMISLSFAHLETGIDREVGPYLLDIGWDPDPPKAGEPVFYAINIMERNTFEKTDFSEVWVRFSKGDRVAFAGELVMDQGSASFSYEFPEAGVWEMDIRFGNYSERVDLEVQEEGPDLSGLGWVAAGFFAIVAFSAFVWGRSRRK